MCQMSFIDMGVCCNVSRNPDFFLKKTLRSPRVAWSVCDESSEETAISQFDHQKLAIKVNLLLRLYNARKNK